MKRVSVPLLLTTICLLATGCSKSPGSVAASHIQAIAAGNTDAALQSFSPDDRKKHGDANIKVLITKIEAAIQHKKGIASVTVADERINGDTASVRLDIKFGNGVQKTEEMPLKKQDGTWYLSRPLR